MLSTSNDGEFLCITGQKGMGRPDDASGAIVGTSTGGASAQLFWKATPATAGRPGGLSYPSGRPLVHILTYTNRDAWETYEIGVV